MPTSVILLIVESVKIRTWYYWIRKARGKFGFDARDYFITAFPFHFAGRHHPRREGVVGT